ncbi:hypothetical protein AAFF_G00098850 [Aldrovandia affinis]|uniref:Uncharacterized protein n=1 Tax=Aldrovandia affinis TaxID=143900 RepID=A0AAD7RVG4_9TELE|nr:hypothetical protein AAFF_G00098850 [Aldrovandia affinis]
MLPRPTPELSRGCAFMHNVHLAYHHNILPHQMHDHVHLNKQGFKVFTKVLKNTALGRSTATPYMEARDPRHLPHTPQELPTPRPQHAQHPGPPPSTDAAASEP